MLHTLRARLIAISIAIVAVALVLLSVVTFVSVRANVLSSLDKQIGDVTRQYARELTEWAQDKQRVSGSLKLATSLAEPQPALDTARQAGAMDSVGFTMSDKRAVYSGWAVPPDFDGTTRPWYKLAVSTGGPAITAAYADANSGELYVSFVEPVFAPAGGALAGVVSADAKLTSVVKKSTPSTPRKRVLPCWLTAPTIPSWRTRARS